MQSNQVAFIFSSISQTILLKLVCTNSVFIPMAHCICVCSSVCLQPQLRACVSMSCPRQTPVGRTEKRLDGLN